MRGIAGGVSPIWSPDGSTIAFAHHTLADGGEVYAVRRDGAGLRRLTQTPWDDDDPVAWSPDGTRLLFVHWPLESDATQLYVTDADGTAQRRLTRLAPYSAVWSPDGTKIAVATFDGLFVVGAHGSGSKRLFSSPHGGGIGWSRIAWSPDGRRIAFGVDGGFGVVDVSGHVLVRPSARGYQWDWSFEMDASWSPDTRTLAYGRPEGGIDLVTAAGRKWRNLSPSGSNPAFAPDGRLIAFSDAGNVYVVRRDGTGLRKLTERLPARPE